MTRPLARPALAPAGYRPRLAVGLRGRLIATGIVLAAVVFVAATATRPAYDPYGWLAWGHQAWGLGLNTDAAPSWKPLTFVITWPLALLGTGAVVLWMVVAAAGAFTAPVLAAVLARRLVSRDPSGWLAAGVAAVAVLDIAGFWHGVLTATADAPIAAACLGAAVCHHDGRRRAAFGLLCLAALGRPEAAPFACLYGAWLTRATPRWRLSVAGALLAVAALWVGVPALTSRTPLSAGTTALAASAPLRGSPVVAVLHNYLALAPWPVHLAALAGVAVAALRRDRAVLWLAVTAGAWVVLWCGLAAGGWEPDGRYMLAPAAIEAALAGSAVAHVVLAAPRRLLWRQVAVAVAAAVCVALLPATVQSGRVLSAGVALGRNWADQLHRLDIAIARLGGRARVLGCGAPVTVLTYQSVLAYDLGANVSSVDWRPGPAIASGRPIVLFLPYVAGWHIRPIHTLPGELARCRALRMTTPFAYSAAFRDFLEDDGLVGRGGLACGLAGTPACPRRARA